MANILIALPFFGVQYTVPLNDTYSPSAGVHQNLGAVFKAKLNLYIPLKTAAIFFLANLYLKQGIGQVYVMVDFICTGLLELQGAKFENYKNEKFLPNAGL